MWKHLFWTGGKLKICKWDDLWGIRCASILSLDIDSQSAVFGREEQQAVGMLRVELVTNIIGK